MQQAHVRRRRPTADADSALGEQDVSVMASRIIKGRCVGAVEVL
jgi:hypothetical protein